MVCIFEFLCSNSGHTAAIVAVLIFLSPSR